VSSVVSFAGLADGLTAFEDILNTPPAIADLLPVAIYACDADGRIRWFNRRAADLWGRFPRLRDNSERFCGSHKILWRDGRQASRDESPMAHALKSGEDIGSADAVIERPDGSRTVATVHISVLKDSDGVLLGAINCFHELAAGGAAETGPAETAPRAHEKSFRDLLEALPVAIYTTGIDGRITFYNRAAVELWGREPGLESAYWCGSWKLFWPDGSAMRHDECPMAQAVKENRSVRGAEAMAERPDGTRFWFVPYPTPLHDSDGRLVGAVNMLIDITDRKRNEKRLELLSRELDHRAKNMLAVVQSIVRLSRADTVTAFSDTLLGRIAALAHAHTLLSESRWEGADLGRLIEEELAPYRSGGRACAEVSGPQILLNSSIAQPIAMALHELTTNAAKYGALSRPDGIVRIEWSCSANGALRLTWHETGGHAVRAPTCSNFGTTLIELTIRDQLNGSVEFDWRPTGLACEIEVPGAELSSEP
jgi:PAS domain S-box-containing protein